MGANGKPRLYTSAEINRRYRARHPARFRRSQKLYRSKPRTKGMRAHRMFRRRGFISLRKWPWLYCPPVRILFAASAVAFAASVGAAPVVWVKVTEPMDGMTWSHVDDVGFIDRECKSDNTLPRVCLYRHLSRCRIITLTAPDKLPPRTREELVRMCGGFFPEPVLLQREFSNPNYLPNQAPPSASAEWKFQNEGNPP